MKLFRKKWGNVCQNCKFGDNKKGKWIKRRLKNIDDRGYWHIFCIKKKKFYRWDKYKRCFEERK